MGEPQQVVRARVEYGPRPADGTADRIDDYATKGEAAAGSGKSSMDWQEIIPVAGVAIFALVVLGLILNRRHD
jgi:hypothetical protein